MQETLIKFGIILIFIGFFLMLAGALLSAKNENIKFGFGGFIGPIPFGFANDPRILLVIIAISLVIFVLFLLSLK